jgi:hypothetical protein
MIFCNARFFPVMGEAIVHHLVHAYGEILVGFILPPLQVILYFGISDRNVPDPVPQRLFFIIDLRVAQGSEKPVNIDTEQQHPGYKKYFFEKVH